MPTTSAAPTEAASRWTSEAQATTALADFVRAAEGATSYKLLRTDRLQFERGYFDTVTTFVVDNAAGLVHLTI